MGKLDGIHPDPWQLVAELRAELAERDETYRRIMDEPCGDERHCTCVPVLRTEVKRLRTVLQTIVDVGDDELIGDAEAGRRMARILREEAAEWN